MIKKIINVVFIVLFLAVLVSPLVFAEFSSGEISESENRYLADLPKLIVDGKLNENISGDTESWFMDHMGFRETLVKTNARLRYQVFGELLNQSDFYIGVNGNLAYATDTMFRDYAHVNIPEQEILEKFAWSYQTISDYIQDRGIQFYYVQCYDKHSIYPEEFVDTVYQYGEKSRTDCVIEALTAGSDVDVIDMKEPMLTGKQQQPVYSEWGDATHWNQRGAFIGYQTIMARINARNENRFPVLQESDFTIVDANMSMRLNFLIYEDDFQEYFQMNSPKAVREDAALLAQWSEDPRHRVWINPEVDNDQTLLLICDSYVADFIAPYFAESFSKVVMIWADYTSDMMLACEVFEPDIMIFETAERAARHYTVKELAESIGE